MLDNGRSYPAATHPEFQQPAHPNGWERLWMREPARTHTPREVWTPEARALLQELPRPVLTHKGLYPLNTFYERLSAAVEHAEQAAQPVAVLVLQLPHTLRLSEHERREMEIALRLTVRREDVPVHPTETTLAIVLPETGSGAALLGARLEQLLEPHIGDRVLWGVALHPQDGKTGLELLRIATRRSLTSRTDIARMAELERLLGPLGNRS